MSFSTIEPKFRQLAFSHPTYLFLLLKNLLKPSLNFFFFLSKFCSFIEKKKIHALIFYSKNKRKHLDIAVKYIEDGENTISFIKDVEITNGKADIIYSALRNENEKCW